MDKMIYLDNNSTTPIDSRVLDAMMPFLTDHYANAASNHKFGHDAKDKIKEARTRITSLIQCELNEIVFSSGATESINLAIKGVADFYGQKRKHIITLATEHTATIDVCKYLENQGYEVSYLGVNKDGLINLSELETALRTDTLLVSVMLVNNETGVIQPVKQIAQMTHEVGAFFMTDATQAFGKIPINVDEMGIDLMAFSGHKIYGPKGVGGLFVRQRRPNKIKLTPLIHGGGHERGMRSGTSNVPGIIGLGMAAEVARYNMEKDKRLVRGLRNKLERELLKIPDVSINGDLENRLYNITSICFKGADADAIMIGLKDIMVSNGSACTSTKIEPSHVLLAMGLSEEDAYSTIRFSLGRFNREQDLAYVVERINEIVSNLREMIRH